MISRFQKAKLTRLSPLGTLLALVCAAALPAQQVSGPQPAVQDPSVPVGVKPASAGPASAEELRLVADLAALVERDARLQFPRTNAPLALADTTDATQELFERAVNAVGLGCLGAENQRARLQQLTTAEDGLERQAAVLGLGELGPASVPFLLPLAGEESVVGEAALVALLRTGSAAGRAGLLERAADGDSALAEVAATLLEFDRDPLGTPAPRALQLLFELRWAAARRYGLIDGRSWSVLLFDELVKNPMFLDLVVLPLAAEHLFPGLQDHLLENLLHGSGRARIDAAVRGIPVEVERLVLSGVWRPEDEAEWRMLVSAIAERKNAKSMQGTLATAAGIPSVQGMALGLLAELQSPQAEALLEERLSSPDPDLRAQVAQALGGTHKRSWIAELDRMRKDPNRQVRAAALVAQVRIGHGPANTRMTELLGKPEDEDRPAILMFMLRVADDPNIRSWLELLYPLTLDREQLQIAIALALQGHVASRQVLRATLTAGTAGPTLPLVVRALGRDADSRDLALLTQLFPLEHDLLGNVELARALVRAGTAEGIEILRAALWREPWNRSALAAALLVKQRGITGLVDELSSPPAGATTRALRRVGFALGEWGGLEQAEALSRRRRSSDPALQGAYLGALSTRTH